MIIDLQKSAIFSISHAMKLSEIEKEMRPKFNDYTQEICEINNFDVYPYFLKISNRNTAVCTIYNDFCKLLLLEDMLAHSQPVKKVLTDSVEMFRAIKSLIETKKVLCEIQLLSPKENHIILSIGLFLAETRRRFGVFLKKET
jgi:hypothetical protein